MNSGTTISLHLSASLDGAISPLTLSANRSCLSLLLPKNPLSSSEKRRLLSYKRGKTFHFQPVAILTKAERKVSEREDAFVPLSERFKKEQGQSEAQSRLLHKETRSGQGIARERGQIADRRASNSEASASGRQNPQTSASLHLLEEVQRDLRGKESTDEGPVFERDEEWEASVFLWKKPKTGPQLFPGTPGPAFLGNERRYFVEDTGKQLRIKRLGKRDKHGPIREERERRRELERQWLEANYGVKLPPTKEVKNVVNRIGGWKVVGQGWVERRRDVEIARVAKSVGLERALEKERLEKEDGQSRVERDTLDDVPLRSGSMSAKDVRKAEPTLQGAEVRKRGLFLDIIRTNETAKGKRFFALKQEAAPTELEGSIKGGKSRSKGALFEGTAALQNEKQEKERTRLQSEGTLEEVERYSGEAVLTHLELKYGKLHVGRLWRQTKIEDDSGWLQVYHDNVFPGHGFIALEPFPESAPVLQDAPPPKYKRPYPVSTKMRKRLDSMPKALLKPPVPETPSSEGVWVRGRPVKLGAPESIHTNRGSATRGERNEKVSGRTNKLSSSGKGLKGQKSLEEDSAVPQPTSLGLKVFEGQYIRLRRLKKLKAKSETGWFEERILAAAQSRISLVVDGRDEAEREPLSKVEVEGFESVGLVVHQKGHRESSERVGNEAAQMAATKRSAQIAPLNCLDRSQEKDSSSGKSSFLADNASRQTLFSDEKEDLCRERMQAVSGGLHQNKHMIDKHGVSEQTRKLLKRTFKVLALRVPEAYADRLATRLEGHLLHWPRISNVWADPTSPSSVSPASDISSDVQSVSPSIDTTLPSQPAQSPHPQSKRWEGFGLRALGTLDVSSSKVKSIASLGDRSANVDQLESLQPLLSRPINHFNALDRQLTVEEVPPGQRLLLLNESLSISYVPRALHVLLGTCPSGGGLQAVQGAALVACELTLDHKYWTADEVVSHLVSSEPGLQVEYVGHIALLFGGPDDLEKKRQLAQVLVDKSPHIRTVIVHPATSTSRPTLVAGKASFFTTTAENGVKLELDMGAVRYDPGLAAERQRLLDTFTSEDVVCDALAGIGALSIAAAKRVRFVHASDPNPSALCYLVRNAQLNGTARNMRLWQLEARDFVNEIQRANPPCFMTQVVLDLTRNSWEALAALRGSFDRGRWGEARLLPRVHIYAIAESAKPEVEISERISRSLGVRPQDVQIQPVQAPGYNNSLFIASFRLPHVCAFDDNLAYD